VSLQFVSETTQSLTFDYTIKGHSLKYVVTSNVVADIRCNSVFASSNTDESKMIELQKMDTFKCDHCKTSHERVRSFIFEDPNGSEFHCGSACVKKYFEDTSSTRIMSEIGMFENFNDLLCEIREQSESYASGIDTTFAYAVENVLTNDKKFFSKKFEEDSTAFKATMIRKEDIHFASDFDYNDVLSFVINLVRQEESAFNLNMLRNISECSHNGVTAYAVYAYLKSIKPDHFMDDSVVTADKNEFVGSIGDSVELVGVVKKKDFVQNQWGGSFSVQIISEGNRLQVYTTSLVLKKGKDNVKDIEIGDTIKFKAVVKNHNEFKEFKTTQLAKIKVLEKLNENME
jgi:hypothetical protein